MDSCGLRFPPTPTPNPAPSPSSQHELTPTQQLGLALFDDFQQRIPRDEAEAMVALVQREAERLAPGCLAECCGSYRRGKAVCVVPVPLGAGSIFVDGPHNALLFSSKTCGDIDILISHPDDELRKGIFRRLLERLHDMGFLTHDLSVGDSQHESTQQCVGRGWPFFGYRRPTDSGSAPFLSAQKILGRGAAARHDGAPPCRHYRGAHAGVGLQPPVLYRQRHIQSEHAAAGAQVGLVLKPGGKEGGCFWRVSVLYGRGAPVCSPGVLKGPTLTQFLLCPCTALADD